MPLNTGKCLVTGAAGFIGSHLVEDLLSDGFRVVGLDNLSTGSGTNLESVRHAVTPAQWERFEFIEGDIRDLARCQQACREVETVFHLAAMASVPVSIRQPLLAHEVNVTGFLNALLAARENGVNRFVFASSSAVYGSCNRLPLQEADSGDLLSPYAATKKANEVYAQAMSAESEMSLVGLRFFNVYGPRQRVNGPYAAVIPLWIDALTNHRPAILYGDGSATRSFCYVKDVTLACRLAARLERPPRYDVFNIAAPHPTSLKELYYTLRQVVGRRIAGADSAEVLLQSERAGDIAHSSADTRKFEMQTGARALTSLSDGLEITVDAWLLERGMNGSQVHKPTISAEDAV